MLEIFKIIGSLAGLVAIIWKIWDSFSHYLHIELTVHFDGQRFIAKTKVENKSLWPKKISNALLLIGPESEDPIDTFNSITGRQAEFTNHIVKCLFAEPTFGINGRAVIPLAFFYSENIRISDECVTYSAPINTANVLRGVPYSVRFFIADKRRLHRSTHDCFMLTNTMNSF